MLTNNIDSHIKLFNIPYGYTNDLIPVIGLLNKLNVSFRAHSCPSIGLDKRQKSAMSGPSEICDELPRSTQNRCFIPLSQLSAIIDPYQFLSHVNLIRVNIS